MADPCETNPELYHVVFENDRVRVLEYLDAPGDRTSPHSHPYSVMITLTSFRRRLHQGGETLDVELPSNEVRWLPSQEHAGENIGDTPTHTFFVELKENIAAPASGAFGPEG